MIMMKMDEQNIEDELFFSFLIKKELKNFFQFFV
jgi:hypothetical protein